MLWILLGRKKYEEEISNEQPPSILSQRKSTVTWLFSQSLNFNTLSTQLPWKRCHGNIVYKFYSGTFWCTIYSFCWSWTNYSNCRWYTFSEKMCFWFFQVDFFVFVFLLSICGQGLQGTLTLRQWNLSKADSCCAKNWSFFHRKYPKNKTKTQTLHGINSWLPFQVPTAPNTKEINLVQVLGSSFLCDVFHSLHQFISVTHK